MKPSRINISDYEYHLPEERIAKFPPAQRDSSRLLTWREGKISETVFSSVGAVLPENSLLVFNNTKVIRARILMRKETGALIEIFCLEPHCPADYERSLAAVGRSEWKCIVGNSKKWKEGPLRMSFTHKGGEYTLTAQRGVGTEGEQTVVFSWDSPSSFGELLETLGRMPIPPYLGRESEEIDSTRYQTVYSRHDGSVAAPTAGLHFTTSLIDSLERIGTAFGQVTLHVGAGTFLPVKNEDATLHEMHTEHFTVTAETIKNLLGHPEKRIAVGTTTVRTLESLAVLGYRIMATGVPALDNPVGQWEAYNIPLDIPGDMLLQSLASYMETCGAERISASTRIMIAPGYTFRFTDGLITNFHQPRSTLLLLVSAFTKGRWREIYDYAVENDFRFLSYGDSSILLK